jgi:valyl-tRNA synthetase
MRSFKSFFMHYFLMVLVDIKNIEEKWRDFWNKEKIYSFNPYSKAKIYSVDTPPPTVSGRMHIGHAFSYSQQDFIVRYKRMKGYNVFYPFGVDNNGVATERLIEKEEHVRSKDMLREDFIRLCLNYLKRELPLFIQDWKKIGISCDWNMEYSTINEHSRKISQWSFLDLYKKKRVYRKDAPAMWCPECQTGISQVEAQDKEVETMFNDIIFKVEGKDVVIATTRPELLPACVAVFYHPSDSRYKKFEGKKAKVPLFNFEVPIMEDARVDREKGTGIVMCCTFGDQTDMEWQKAYNLPIKEAIKREGKMTELAGKYQGMTIREARKTITDDLKKHKLLKNQKKIIHIVNVHERCGTEIEFVKSKQWFVKYLDLKREMIKWGRKLNWYPKFMEVRYDNWIKGLQWDWLISRQRHFGIPFPVWYCKKCGEVVVAEEKDLPVDPLAEKPNKKCKKCGCMDFIAERDVLDTWFTSSMSPIIATKLLDKKNQEKAFPMSLRPQAHEIISFWLFNTVVKSNMHFNKNPWKDVVISGIVTLKGEKMSKSKGNIVNPQDVIKNYGADALRYWAASSRLGEDFDYQEKDVITGKRFITKLLNASKFVFINLKNRQPKKTHLIDTDRIFLIKLNELIIKCTNAFEKYEYSKAKSETDYFFWNIFCDNYLEIVKNRVYNGTDEEKESAFYTLYNLLLTILKLMAPFTPFIIEEIYQKYFRDEEKTKSIHITKWPDKIKIEKKRGDDERFALLIDIINKVRQKKSLAKKSMNSKIKLAISKKEKEILEGTLDDLKAVTNAVEIREGNFKVEFV